MILIKQTKNNAAYDLVFIVYMNVPLFASVSCLLFSWFVYQFEFTLMQSNMQSNRRESLEKADCAILTVAPAAASIIIIASFETKY